MKMRDFVGSSHLPSRLINAVIRQIGGWEEFQHYAPSVINREASSGFAGFTLPQDTASFFCRNRKVILIIANEIASKRGIEASEMVASSPYLGEYSAEDVCQTLFGPESGINPDIAEVLSWYALEEVCRAYVSFVKG